MRTLASEIGEQMPLVPVANGRATRKPLAWAESISPPTVSPGGAAMMERPKMQVFAAALSREQYAALPWRLGSEGTLEVLLLRSRPDSRWTIPGGLPCDARTALQTAERAALSEAGVTGRLGPEPVGRYRVTREHPHGRRELSEVTVFGLHVWGTLINWPKDRKVVRRWMKIDDARRSVADPGLADVLSSLLFGATTRPLPLDHEPKAEAGHIG